MKRRALPSGGQLPATHRPASRVWRTAGNNDYVLDPLLQSPSPLSISSSEIRGLSPIISSPATKPKRASTSPPPPPREEQDNVAASSSCPASVYCPDCGKCRCEVCTTPRTLPHTTICQDRVTCSPDAVVEACTCMTAARFIIYHGLGGGRATDDNDDVTDVDEAASHPCACRSRPFCCERWTCLVGASVLCPCLCLYWPLHGCLRLVQCLHDRCRRPGCRCKPPVSPTSSSSDRSNGDDERSLASSPYSNRRLLYANQNDVITSCPPTLDNRLQTSALRDSNGQQSLPPPVLPRKTLSQCQGQRCSATPVTGSTCRRRVPSPPPFRSSAGDEFSDVSGRSSGTGDGTRTLPQTVLPQTHRHAMSVPSTPCSSRLTNESATELNAEVKVNSAVEPGRPPPPLPRKQNVRIHVHNSASSVVAPVSRDTSCLSSSNVGASVHDNDPTLISDQQVPVLPPKKHLTRGVSVP